MALYGIPFLVAFKLLLKKGGKKLCLLGLQIISIILHIRSVSFLDPQGLCAQERPRVLCVRISLRSFVSITNEIITRASGGSARRLINLSGKPVQNKPSQSLWKNLGRVPIAAKP